MTRKVTDQKDYTHRGFDWQDTVVLWACTAAVAALGLLLWVY